MLQISYYFEDKQLDDVGLALSNMIDALLFKHKIKIKKLKKLNIEFLDKHIESQYYKPDPVIGAIGTYMTYLEVDKAIVNNRVKQQVVLFEKTQQILEECNTKEAWGTNFDAFFEDMKIAVNTELPLSNNESLIAFFEKKIKNIKEKSN